MRDISNAFCQKLSKYALRNLGLALLGLHASTAAMAQYGAPTAPPPPPPPICAIRPSVYESFPPFAAATAIAVEAKAQTQADAAAKSIFARLDRETAAVISQAPASGEATLALVDLERQIDTLDKCGEKYGWGAIMQQARTALIAAFQKNRSTLLDPAYSSRLLRSATAQAVLKNSGDGAVIDKAVAIKAKADAEAATARRLESEQRMALYQKQEAERKIRENEIRTGWRTNVSAPPADSRFCDSYGVIDYASKPKDINWLNMMDYEARSGCLRITTRKDGPFYMGLALGTAVTDEQLAHAVGNVYLCFSNSKNRQNFNKLIASTREMNALFGGDAVGTGLRPTWNDAVQADGKRRVVVGCEVQFSILGMDMAAASKSAVEASGVDRQNFVEFELSGNILQSVRLRSWIPNVVSSETNEDYYTKNRSTTTICNADLARADGIAGQWQQSSWAIAQQAPYSFTNPNGARRSGKWMVLKRGTLSADIWNVSYDAPVLGESGNCFGGAVEHFVTLNLSRGSKIKTGVPKAF